MRRMSRRPFLAAGIGTVGVIAAACGGSATPSGGATSGGQPTTVKIMVGGLSKQIYLPNKLTEALGYFKEQNLNVQLLDEPSGVGSENEVVSGNVDLGSGSFDHTIDLQAAGKAITAAIVLLQSPGEAVMVSAKKASALQSPKDWKGVSAGVTSLGSGTHTLMRALAVRAGLQVSDVNFVQAGAGDTFIAAMKQGTIDVGMTTQPTVLRLLKAGDAQMQVNLFTPTTTRAALGGDYPFVSLWGRAEYLAKNQATVQRVVNAYVKTLKWIGAHTPAEITDQLPSDYWAGDKAAYVQALTDSMPMFSPDGKMPPGAPDFVLSVVSQFSDTIKATKIDLTKTYTSTFVDQAK